MDFKELVDIYFDKIEIVGTDYIPWDDSKHDSAYIGLRVPSSMLEDYLNIKGWKRFPICFGQSSGRDFWKDTMLCEKLRGSDKYKGQGNELLEDMLESLGCDVQVDFYPNKPDLDKLEYVDLSVMEVPEFYEETE